MKFRKVLMLLFAFTFANVNGQNKVQGYIFDKQTLNPLPYATIGALHQKYGTYTDTSGFFTLFFINESDSLLISYLGYKNVYTSVGYLNKNTKSFLEPMPINIKEVVVRPKKSRKTEMEIGDFSKKSIGYINPPYHLNIQATFIPFPKEGDCVVIKSICFKYKLLTYNSPLRIRILKPDKLGKPGDDIVTENIIFNNYRRNGKQIAIIDVTKYNITIPQNGVFIAFEWIDHNKNLTTLKDQNTEHGPCIGAISNKNNKSIWSKGYNQQFWFEGPLPLTYAVGLTLVNYTD